MRRTSDLCVAYDEVASPVPWHIRVSSDVNNGTT